MTFSSRVAVVTGHSQGLGQALTAGLLAQGWRVLGVSRQGCTLSGVAGHPGLTEESLDLADTEALASWLAAPMWRQWLAGADSAWLINNAGTVQPMGAPGLQDPEVGGRAVALNVAAPLMLADAFVAATAGMADRRIVHISSGAARNAYAGWSIYCATKAALDMHARATQMDAVPGLRVESLAPGVLDTGMQAQIRGTDADRFPMRERFVGLHRDGGLLAPADVAGKLLAHMGSDAFGQQPVTDLRQLG
jgi:NAD(P)-dependent dehydrogenase (short-subunit alcohol dehydrogenase family)